MARVSQHQHSASSVQRLNLPDALDLDALETSAAKPQRGAWRYLIEIFHSAKARYCKQFSIEPDNTCFRLRYQLIEGFEEHIITDPSVIVWALEALQIELWNEDYHKLPNRVTRFIWNSTDTQYVVTLRAIDTVNGETLQFDLEPIAPLPPMLDEVGLTPTQLQELRIYLQRQQGMLLVTSSDSQFLDDMLLAINQELISPDRKVLSISDMHRYSLPRTTQIDLASHKPSDRERIWQTTLDTYHDVLLCSTHVPECFQEQISDRCDHEALAVQTMRVTHSADAINLLNASILRRAPMHRATTSVLNHFPVASVCPECASRSELNKDEQAWLEGLRTPATENVISWLVDGNVDQFMVGAGCDGCANTGFGKSKAVFNLLHRDTKSNQFPTQTAMNTSSKANTAGAPLLQRQLMSLAKAGTIPLSEVVRVLRSSTK